MATQKIPGRAIKLGTDTAGDVMYFDGAAWRRLPIGEPGQLLTMNASGTFPEWYKFVYGGTQFGYGVMGMTGAPGPVNTVDKFSFTSDTNAVDHCDAFSIGSHHSCSRSGTHGYANAGEIWPHYTVVNRITKFAFASTANGTDVADVLVAIGYNSGNSSGTYGYVCGGVLQDAATRVNTIQKYSVTTDVNATDVGDLSEVIGMPTSANSTIHGYRMGGNVPLPVSSEYSSERIDKFSFATDGNASDIANLTIARGGGTGCSSETHGYCAGGHSYTASPVGYQDRIDKFLFATGADATDVGNLTLPNGVCGGSSSTTNGYVLGGYINYIDRIDKFPFATDSNASDIANLTAGRDDLDGTQN